MTAAPFLLAEGHSVTVPTPTGFVTGHFERWDRKGRAVVAVPELGGRRLRVEPSQLRPCNDARMIRLRGRIPWPRPTPRTKEASK